MYIVTVDEAREHLAELIAHVAAGETVVISDGGKAVAELIGPPGFPTTPEEVEATREKREGFIRECLGVRADAPLPIPGEMTTDEYMARYRIAE
jgi:prevent-host-death family protein